MGGVAIGILLTWWVIAEWKAHVETISATYVCVRSKLSALVAVQVWE